MRNWKYQAAACATALALAACGGGGGHDGTADATGTVTVKPDGTGGGAAGGNGSGGGGGSGGGTGPADAGKLTTLTGVFQFESVPIRDKGGLDYAAPRIVRNARAIRMEVWEAFGKKLSTATTDSQGRFSFQVPPQRAVVLVAIASMPTPGALTDNDTVDVADNTRLNENPDRVPVYQVKSMPVYVGAEGLSITFLASSPSPLPTSKADTAPRPAAPFAILDTVYEAQAKVHGAMPELKFQPLLILWSTRNRPSTVIDVVAGQIPGAAFTSDSGLNLLFLNGQRNINTDDNDPSVITHEWGHYLQRTLSRDDTFGGTHWSGDLLDRNMAFSEGFGDAFSGMVLGLDRYIDSYGENDATSFVFDLKDGPATQKGWFNEQSITKVLWRLHEAVGLEPIVKALTGPFRSTIASTGIHSFNASLLAVSPQAAGIFRNILQDQGIHPGADAWGRGETNSGGSDVALPMIRDLTVGGVAESQVCVSGSLDPKQEGNKLGRISYLRFTVPAKANHRVLVTGAAPSVPDFRITGQPGFQIAIPESAGIVNDAVLELDKGDYLLAIADKSRPAGKSCFTVQIQ